MSVILVTGATGFIGSALCQSLCDLGHDVIAFHRYNSDIGLIEKLPLHRVIGDLTDDNSIENAFSYRPEIVFHLAAQHVSGRSSARLMEVNVGGTRRILQASFNAGIKRVVLMSSALTLGTAEPTFGQLQSTSAMTETHQWNSALDNWPFALSKRFVEQEAQWAAAFGMDIVICNPMMVCGAGDHYRKTTSMIARYRRKPPAFLVEGGINLIDIQDVVQGLIGAMNYGETGKRYLLSGTNLSYDALFQVLSDLTGEKKPTMQLPTGLSNRLFDYKIRHPDLFLAGSFGNDMLQLAGKHFYFDGTDSRLALHLPPTRNIKDSIVETLDWFEKNI